MVNQTLEAGRLVSRAISEVKSSHRGMSMTQVLIDSGLVGSDSALSWIRKGKVKDIRRYVLVINEVTKFLPPSRRDYYRLRMFDIVVVIYSGLKWTHKVGRVNNCEPEEQSHACLCYVECEKGRI